MTGSHTAEYIGGVLRELLALFDLTDKAWHATTDNAEPWVKAIRGVLGIQHSRCFAHSLQLLVSDAISSHSKEIDRARDVVTLFHRSPNKAEMLAVLQKQMHLPAERLKTDVTTRWQSTHDMIKSVVDNRRALDVCPHETIPLEKQLDEHEFDVLAQLEAGLEPYAKVTEEIQGEKYPTMNELLPTWFELVGDAEDYANTRRARGTLAQALLAQMDKRSDKITSQAAILSCLLDPRFRQLRCFGSDSDGKEQTDQAMKLLREQYRKEKAIVESEAARAPVEAKEKKGEGKEAMDQKERESGKDEKKVPASPAEPAARCANAKRKADEHGEQPKPKFVRRVNKRFADVKRGRVRDEVDSYMELDEVNSDDDPLLWWRNHKELFPVLARLARKYLAIPATSAPVERVWSTAGNVLTKKRARLSDEMLNNVVFLHENFDMCLEAAKEIVEKERQQKEKVKEEAKAKKKAAGAPAKSKSKAKL